jgi:hypothetical protein
LTKAKKYGYIGLILGVAIISFLFVFINIFQLFMSASKNSITKTIVSNYGSYAFQQRVEIRQRYEIRNNSFISIEESMTDGIIATQIDKLVCQEISGQKPDPNQEFFLQNEQNSLSLELEKTKTLLNYFTNQLQARLDNNQGKNQDGQNLVDLSEPNTDIVGEQFFPKKHKNHKVMLKLHSRLNALKMSNKAIGFTNGFGNNFNDDVVLSPTENGSGTNLYNFKQNTSQESFRTKFNHMDGQDLDGDGYIDTPWGVEQETSSKLSEFLIQDTLTRIGFAVKIFIKTASDHNLLIIAKEFADPTQIISNPNQLHPLNPNHLNQIIWSEVSEVSLHWTITDIKTAGLNTEYIASDLRRSGFAVETGNDGGINKKYLRIVV